MIGFSIMMLFVAFLLFMLAVSLLRGNISSIHGKVFDAAEDKVGYAKNLGRPCLLLSIGFFISSIIGILNKSDAAIVYALIESLIVIILAAIWFLLIQKRYKNLK